MEEIKRYNLEQFPDEEYLNGEMARTPNGKYVKYDDIKHLLKQPTDWISVDDKMPEEKRWVLGLVETTGHIQPVILQVHLNENGIWKDLQGNIPDGSWEVIYWKPLPNPPKQ
jgi:hypothetical protein